MNVLVEDCTFSHNVGDVEVEAGAIMYENLEEANDLDKQGSGEQDPKHFIILDSTFQYNVGGHSGSSGALTI